MNSFELGEQLIIEFLTGIRDDIVEYMRTEKRNATGRSSASLKVTTTSSSGQLTGNGGIEYVLRGRGPGGIPPISAIIDWLNAKGLPRGMAWNVARLIAKLGTRLHREGRNILNEIITEEKINNFRDKILVTFRAQFVSEIKSVLQAA